MLIIEAILASEIRDTAFRGYTGSSEEYDVFALTNHLIQLVDTL